MTGLARWFLAIYLVTSSKGGVSALELQRQMGFKSYQTALRGLLAAFPSGIGSTRLLSVDGAGCTRSAVPSGTARSPGGMSAKPTGSGPSAHPWPSVSRRTRPWSVGPSPASAVPPRVATRVPFGDRIDRLLAIDGAAGKTVVAGAIEAEPGSDRKRRLGRVRMAAVPDASA